MSKIDCPQPVTNNSIVVQEARHRFKFLWGKLDRFITWKIDLGKAYDKLQLQIVKEVSWEIGLKLREVS